METVLAVLGLILCHVLFCCCVHTNHEVVVALTNSATFEFPPLAHLLEILLGSKIISNICLLWV